MLYQKVPHLPKPVVYKWCIVPRLLHPESIHGKQISSHICKDKLCFITLILTYERGLRSSLRTCKM